MIEWPEIESAPTKYYFLTLKRQTTLRKLVYAAKGRWPIERDYEELKDVDLGHYEVRGWRGFHHHAMMSIAAYAFLIMERGLFSPCGDPCQSRWQISLVSGGNRSDECAHTPGKTRPNFDCDHAYRIRRCDGQASPSVPVLPKIERPHVIISWETRDFCDTEALEDLPRLDGVRILVVDDEADERLLPATMLADTVANVRTAGSITEAISTLDGWRPDVLVSDIGMLNGDGYELLREIRKRDGKLGQWLPAAALTAYARSEDRVRALAAGFQTRVAKPVEPRELLMVIANLAERGMRN